MEGKKNLILDPDLFRSRYCKRGNRLQYFVLLSIGDNHLVFGRRAKIIFYLGQTQPPCYGTPLGKVERAASHKVPWL